MLYEKIWIIGLYVLFLLILVGIIIMFAIAISSYQNKKYTDIVKKSSERYKMLLKLNERFLFHQEIKSCYEFVKQLQSKPQFDRFNMHIFFSSLVEKDAAFFQNIIEAVKQNRELWSNYVRELEKLPHMTELSQQGRKVSYKKYVKKENRLICEAQLSPIIAPQFICVAGYTSPKGRNSYSKKVVYTFEECVEYWEKGQIKIKERNTQEYRRREERGKMTASLRYDILRRDGFRCVLCGCSAEDGVKLHIDHIIPIAKGGKTSPENLRTLCERCNLGKSDKIEELFIK